MGSTKESWIRRKLNGNGIPWREHKELRYIVNNGITLCYYHHPRKPSEEKRLSPYFSSLIKIK